VDRRYGIDDAKHDALVHMEQFMKKSGYDASVKAEITEVSAFRILNDYSSSGTDIRVRCQVKPGLIRDLHTKGRGAVK